MVYNSHDLLTAEKLSKNRIDLFIFVYSVNKICQQISVKMKKKETPSPFKMLCHLKTKFQQSTKPDQFNNIKKKDPLLVDDQTWTLMS